MDTSRKVNSNAGKGAKYTPGEVSQNFGEPNMVSAGAGISATARVSSQPHGAAGSAGKAPTDLSAPTSNVAPPGMSTDNQGKHPAGVSGPSNSVAGGASIPAPGDGGRRGAPHGGQSRERYRGRG